METLQFLDTPSSCELDVLNLRGQLGHVKSLFSFSGGFLRFLTVLRILLLDDLMFLYNQNQYPPPITTTCLSFADIFSLSCILSPSHFYFEELKNPLQNEFHLIVFRYLKSLGSSEPHARTIASNSLVFLLLQYFRQYGYYI